MLKFTYAATYTFTAVGWNVVFKFDFSIIILHLQCCAGVAKKDDMNMPLKFSLMSDEQQANLSHLALAREIFIQWKESGYAGLTDQTFLACIQTISAVPELVLFLHRKFGFNYILPGKFTSDPIEVRFGWYRQVNGGYFFMSLKQVLEVEKKIRRLSLMQQHGLK